MAPRLVRRRPAPLAAATAANRAAAGMDGNLRTHRCRAGWPCSSMQPSICRVQDLKAELRQHGASMAAVLPLAAATIQQGTSTTAEIYFGLAKAIDVSGYGNARIRTCACSVHNVHCNCTMCTACWHKHRQRCFTHAVMLIELCIYVHTFKLSMMIRTTIEGAPAVRAEDHQHKIQLQLYLWPQLPHALPCTCYVCK